MINKFCLCALLMLLSTFVLAQTTPSHSNPPYNIIRYKFARYYAPNAFNVPKTLEQIFKYNDVQLFDLQTDPNEIHNLALQAEKYKELILHMNNLLNELIAKEVGVNDGSFLPPEVRPKTLPLTFN